MAETVIVGTIGPDTDWSRALDGVRKVVHCAARAHFMDGVDRVCLQRDAFLETNARGTEQLGVACVLAGVRSLVYVSSIKVHGDQTTGIPYRAMDPPSPRGAYAISKWEGERRLFAACSGSALQVSVVRSPLVYGPGVRGNFYRLMRWVELGIPLPFGAVSNRRSLVCVWNLCDLIERLLRGDAAVQGVFLVSDDDDLSTPELVRRLARALDRPARLLSVRPVVLETVGRLLGRGEEMSRLSHSLVVDIRETRTRLGWVPSLTVDEGLSRTVASFRSRVR